MAGPFTTPVAESTPFEPERNPDYNGEVGTIESENVQDAIEEVFFNAPGKQARFTLILTENGNLQDGQRFGYNELVTNTPVILPRKCRLKEVSYANDRSNADALFEFYRRNPPETSSTPGPNATLEHTWNFTNLLTGSQTGLDILFEAGDEILVRFTDTGQNPRDSVMVLFFVNDDT